jgi:outer membrane protein
MYHREKNMTLNNPHFFTAVLFAAFLTFTGCTSDLHRVLKSPGTSPSPDESWIPAPGTIPELATESNRITLPEDLLKSGQSLNLLSIVDIALRNNPETAAAWAEARSAAAEYGSRKGEYYPQIEAITGVKSLRGSSGGGKSAYKEVDYSAAAQINWLIFDFGGRKSSVEEAREALIAADWSHNAVIQNVIFEVQNAYYNYLTVKALLEAQQATYKEAETNVEASKDRHHAGVATIADVLQAKTALAQAQLAIDRLQGQIQTTRGALATAMGLPANTPYDIVIPKKDIHIKKTVEKVEAYLAQAEKQRPDLAAARAQVRKASAGLRKVKAQAYPSINGTSYWERIYFDTYNTYGNNYSNALQLSIPIFTGYSQHYNEIRARADEEATRARLNSLEQQVVLEVWTSYYNLKTAEQRVRTSEDLLKSATESYKVALGRYKAGVGSILDLLSAQSALEGARAQRILATSDWFVSLAALARDTGTLTVSGTNVSESVPITMEEVE